MASIRTIGSFVAIACLLPAQNSLAPDPQKPKMDGHTLMALTGYEVNGTRFPASSIIRLSGLRMGQMVNYDIMGEASNRITSTGLVSAVKCAYNLDPAKPGVAISLTLTDELPLLPARIEPAEEADRIWSCLQSADPIFTRQLPNTKDALRFYATNIDRCLSNAGQHTERASSTVLCNAEAKPGEIVFHIKRKQPSSNR